MPRLVDTTLRLLGQEPLAGTTPTSELLRLAEILDSAGFAYLEVSGGGCFDSAVKRGVESPWERIRAIKARTQTPLAMALRGRFLVGSRPVGVDLVRRFVACAADSGIDVFRLHDPLNDISNLREAAEAITAADHEFDAGLVQAVRDASGLPVGLYCQGSGGTALAAALEASRAGADLIATAVYPLALTLHRVSGESVGRALAAFDLDTGVDIDALWRASDIVDEHIGDEPVTQIP